MKTLRRGCVAGLFVMLSLGVGAQSVSTPAAPELPILGLAGITFQVTDLDKARHFYDGVLGFPEAFTLKDASGRVTSVFFKINDDQYVEVVPGLPPGALRREVRVMFQSSDLTALRNIYQARALNPSPITRGPDGNPVFRIVGPVSATLD